MSNLNSNQRTSVRNLLEKLILEDNQFDVHDFLPNTAPDPASLNLHSDYACPLGEVVVGSNCGKFKGVVDLSLSRLLGRIPYIDYSFVGVKFE